MLGIHIRLGWRYRKPHSIAQVRPGSGRKCGEIRVYPELQTHKSKNQNSEYYYFCKSSARDSCGGCTDTFLRVVRKKISEGGSQKKFCGLLIYTKNDAKMKMNNGTNFDCISFIVSGFNLAG